MSERLRGKVVCCTGGGSGIGRAVVEGLIEEGARVVVLEIDPDKARELSLIGPGLVALVGDARDPESNQELVAVAGERFGAVDALVTFVGVFDHYTSLGELGERLPAVFEEVISLNVLSPLVSAAAALAALRESRGSIVFTLSSSSFYPARGGVVYVASKFALRGAMLRLAHELAPEVRVNGVAPGGTLGTDLRAAASLGLGSERLDDLSGRREALIERTPMHVALEPHDHVGAYLYLLSDQSRGVTAEVIKVDGGLSAR